jgi:hypothetical protein
MWSLRADRASRHIGNGKAMTLIHNPDAANPVPVGLLPSYDEYVATPNGADEYKLEQVTGLLRR